MVKSKPWGRLAYLHLKKLELHGFKSFAEPIEVEFQPGINVIVGPNGSGKSNITDSIRWVLGEQSIRNLRGAKLEDVIFAGSKLKKPLGMAEVSITLDNTDNLLPVDFVEICFTRRVFRSGESQFFINKTPCRLKDIQEILMDTGIGKDGYSIISQGQIEEILISRPEERRAIFEETAGISKHKGRKREAEKNLQDTMANILRIDDILNEMQNQIIPLKLQKEKALRYKEISSQIRELDVNLLLSNLEDKKQKINSITETIQKYDDLLTQTVQEKSRLQNNLIQDKSMLNLKEADYETLNEEFIICCNRKKDIEKDLQLLKDEKSRLNETLEDVSKSLTDIQRKITTAKQQLEEGTYNLDQCIQFQDELKSKLIQNENKLTEFDETIEQKEININKIKQDVIEILNSTSGKKNKITNLNTIKANLVNRIEQIQKEILDIEEVNSITDLEIKNAQGELEKFRVKYQQYVNKLEQLERYRADKDRELTKEKELFSSEKEKYTTLVSKVNTLKDVNDNYDGFYFGVKNLLTALKNKSFEGKGIYGTVADVIKVDKEYEIAIETALGGALQNIICEKEENAKYAIDYLKRRNLGRVTFLPLTTIKPKNLFPRENQILTLKGCLGCGEQLVSFDNRFYPIISYLLGRVIVASDIDAAIYLAKSCNFSLKIVTLDGELINPGGSITGGSQKKASFILTRKRELLEAAEKVNEMERDLSIYKQNLLQMENQLQEKQNMISTYKEDIIAINLKIATLENQLIEKQNQFKERLQRKRKLEAEGQELRNKAIYVETKIDEIGKDVTILTDSSLVNQNQIKMLQADIDEHKAKRELIIQKLTDIKIELASKKQEQINLTQFIANLNESINSLEAETNILEEKSCINKDLDAEINDDIKSCEEQLERANAKQVELQTRLSEIKQIRESIKIRLDENQNRFDKLLSIQKQYERTLNDQRLKKVTLTMEIKQIEEKLRERYDLSIEEAMRLKKDLGPAEKLKATLQELKKEIMKIGTVNLQAIADYDNLYSRYIFLKTQRDDLTEAKAKLDDLIKDLTKVMEEMFEDTFEKVKIEFQKVFKQLFNGGKAELVLQGEGSLLDAGIEIIAQPPGKKLQNLSLLSGGEKALTAIALLFAILNIKDTPFCVLDEIEATLDDANIDRFTNYLKKLSERIQFIIITHRKNTMIVADALYGVTMEDTAVSKILAVKMET